MKSDFETKTNWCVFTGAPSSGKTSVIDDLAARGFKTETEVARELIEELMRTGKTLEEIRADNKGLQTEILRRKIALEQSHNPKDVIFLDRGLPDSLAYFRMAGLPLEPVYESCRKFRYAHVFVFDRLPIVKDGVRSEDEAVAAHLARDFESDYKALGYSPIRVPVMPIQGRADFILNEMKKAA